MSGETLYEAPRRHNVTKMRVHDYLYDSAFIVSGARDYARMAFKSAMASAQIVIRPVFNTMFSEIKNYPRMNIVYHPNCRLPPHVDRSYAAYVSRVRHTRGTTTPQLEGRDRFRFSAVPKKLLALPSMTPEFHPPSPVYKPPETKPRNRATQSLYRESSAQTAPWQPDGRVADNCTTTPEVLYLDKLEWGIWLVYYSGVGPCNRSVQVITIENAVAKEHCCVEGPGNPYRTGDLPADFHTTEIINKLRHARAWDHLVEQGKCPRWMKRTNAIISDVETKDWIFREAEIDELQGIRHALLRQLQSQTRETQNSRTRKKLANLWAQKKVEMEKKIENIRRTRDRELRKLSSSRSNNMGMDRSAGSMIGGTYDPTSDFAPLARHGYQARRRHAEIVYDPSLLSYEDHEKLAQPPDWVHKSGQDSKYGVRGEGGLCPRETKWSEQFLEDLHSDLKKARLGADSTAVGPLRVLKPRQPVVTPRPATPEVEPVEDAVEASHQSALVLQKIIRGRAVQNLMYEGCARASELIEELKTTHGLQEEDKARIAKDEAKTREYNALRTEDELKEDAISALVDEVCGGAVASALDFLEKELRRLKEERRQHAFILIALREKTMREAAEAGRRQKEERRRREHDEMFRQILGVTQETVDAYFHEIVSEGVLLAAEEEAVHRAQTTADKIDEEIREQGSMSTAEQNELVAELVQQFLLPEAHKAAARYRVSSLQKATMDAARKSIFQVIDDAGSKQGLCTKCGGPLNELCRCRCLEQVPTATVSRDDPRWKYSRTRPRPEPKTVEERFPPYHEIRGMLNVLIDEVVTESRERYKERDQMYHDMRRCVRERTEVNIDAAEMVDKMVDRASGTTSPPIKVSDYHHYMKRVIGDALERSQLFEHHSAPEVLPSELRRRGVASGGVTDATCHCNVGEDVPEDSGGSEEVPARRQLETERTRSDETPTLLPSELRTLEDMRKCKCDTEPAPNSNNKLL